MLLAAFLPTYVSEKHGVSCFTVGFGHCRIGEVGTLQLEMLADLFVGYRFGSILQWVLHRSDTVAGMVCTSLVFKAVHASNKHPCKARGGMAFAGICAVGHSSSCLP